MGKQKGKKAESHKDMNLENLEKGRMLCSEHPLFSRIGGCVHIDSKGTMGKKLPYLVYPNGEIYLNPKCYLTPKQWAYGIAHCGLHLSFGHFEAEKMPGYEIIKEDGSREKKVACDKSLWNLACDIYIAKFLATTKFGEPVMLGLEDAVMGKNIDETGIYEMLLDKKIEIPENYFRDMAGLEKPIVYQKEEERENSYSAQFAYAMADAVSESISIAGGYDQRAYNYKTLAQRAANWFINHYPLLGGVAASFKIIEDRRLCEQEEIHIAAVDVDFGEIYINPAAGLDEEELKFVLAHEFLHAGLEHRERCQGRNEYLWNVACDFVINGWLADMQIGKMPKDILYDASLKDFSAETIYDIILENIRKYAKIQTFRGFEQGDILWKGFKKFQPDKNSMNLDEFFKSALRQGLDYHEQERRGFIPVGLMEEIRALSMPPIPWDVELAEWFNSFFLDLEKKRTYARPSRRQASTPDIVRPRYVWDKNLSEGRTFGVVIDTSGSMSAKMIGMALGSIASYAVAKNVPYARVVFCDARAYDAGYLSPEDIAGRVEVKGRGGTVLQPGVDLLEQAKDFPKKGPILIITDGWIEEKMDIHREHAFLVPKGRRLPFRARGKVFYFE